MSGNTVLPDRYDELLQRLALGVEPIDAACEQPMPGPVMLTHDELPLGHRRQAFQRHLSNRQVLLYDARTRLQAQTLTLRLFDQSDILYSTAADRRRFVPRRLRIDLPTLAQADAQPPAARACRPLLFPGAAYPVSESLTGLRAHAMRTAPLRPARWARVWATLPAAQEALDSSTVVGRACCDERGEFLLLIRHHPLAQHTVLPGGSVLSLRVRVFAAPEPVPASAELPALDPLWDAPIEAPLSLADADPVLRGERLPADYVQVVDRVIDFPLGRLMRGQPSLTF